MWHLDVYESVIYGFRITNLAFGFKDSEEFFKRFNSVFQM